MNGWGPRLKIKTVPGMYKCKIDAYYTNPQILKTSKKFNIWNFNNTYHPIKSPGMTVICCDVGSVYVLYPGAKTKK